MDLHQELLARRKLAFEETSTCCQTLASMTPVAQYIGFLEAVYEHYTGEKIGGVGSGEESD